MKQQVSRLGSFITSNLRTTLLGCFYLFVTKADDRPTNTYKTQMGFLILRWNVKSHVKLAPVSSHPVSSGREKVASNSGEWEVFSYGLQMWQQQQQHEPEPEQIEKTLLLRS